LFLVLVHLSSFLPVAPRQQEASDFKTAGFSDTLIFIKSQQKSISHPSGIQLNGIIIIPYLDQFLLSG